MKVLGIESSADDTGVALIDAEGEFGAAFQCSIAGNTVSSQPLHAEYGGIFPAMAKREHSKNFVPTLFATLEEAGSLKRAERPISVGIADILEREPELLELLQPFLEQYERPDIDVIAVTHGPGLEPCLWSGINAARALSICWNVPIVPVNHMEGHLVMSTMNMPAAADSSILQNTAIKMFEQLSFPAIVLLVSGGHTDLILMRGFGDYKYIGRTRDDAAGEAFDKIARLIDLSYPGGPEISRLAEEARKRKLEPLIKLPRPMITSNDYDFSFSGLKTAVERFVAEHEWRALDRERIAREVENAITDVLLYKTLRAVEEYGASTVIMSGGVSANKHIREEMNGKLSAVGCTLLVCPPKFSTDNGLMIALAGYFRALNKEFIAANEISAHGTLNLSEPV
jgi:N6-L-threonylcarbamoyladenine synthase